MEYKHRMQGQAEIMNFIKNIFNGRKELDFNQYCEVNRKVSSEMFFSIMSILQERLPCSQNIFRLKRIYKTKIKDQSKGIISPLSAIA